MAASRTVCFVCFCAMYWRQLGVTVARWSLDQRGYFTSGPVSAEMGDRVDLLSASHPRSTQPGHPFTGRRSEYWHKLER